MLKIARHVLALFIPLTLILSPMGRGYYEKPALCQDALAPRSRFNEMSDVSRYITSPYGVAPAPTEMKRLPGGVIEIQDSLRGVSEYSISMTFAGRTFVCEKVYYDEKREAFIVKMGKVTTLIIHRNGIIMVHIEGQKPFPLTSAPPTFMEEEASSMGLGRVRGGIREALDMNWIKSLHPELNLYYMVRLSKTGINRNNIFIYPAFESAPEEAFLVGLISGQAYGDGIALDNEGKLCGIMESGLHKGFAMRIKFYASSLMAMHPAKGLGLRIGEELTFFVSGIHIPPRENGNAADPKMAYRHVVRRWARSILEAKLPLPQRIAVEDAQLNRRFLFNVPRGRVNFGRASLLFADTTQPLSLGHFLEDAYRLRTPLRGGCRTAA